jgi:endoglucanase
MKRTALIISVLPLLIISTEAFASKLVWLKVVDQNYMMVQFKDGDINFVDNASGSTAYTGDHWTGNNYKVTYGSALDTTNAVATTNWVIKSTTDANYGTTGKNPTNCYRKSKLNGMAEMDWNNLPSPNGDFIYDYTMEHTIYLKLPYPLAQGISYTIEINSNTNSDVLSRAITFDIFNSPSEAIHVNLVGYLNDASTKAVDLYIWMGNGGARDYSTFVGKKVYIYNVNTSASQEVGTVAYWKNSDVNTGNDVGWFNLTMSTVWKADFTGFNTPGTYRIVIEGVGCSENFEIKKYAYFEPFRLSTIGFFYMRIGEDSNYTGMPVPRRPLYIPYVSPASTRVYITTMQPWHPSWSTIPDDKWDNPTNWDPYKTGAQNNNAVGGHSDAADWDRHLGHISIIYDMLLPYILTDGRMNDDNLKIAESGNGIPDILDEARNEVDFWLNLRDGNGYSYGLTNPTGSGGNALYQAGTTAISAWANAANASMLANCFMLAGINDLRDTYTTAAVTAYNYANGLSDQQLTATQDAGYSCLRGKDLKMMAAAYLYNLTGDVNYENTLNSLSDVTSTTSIIHDGTMDQLWACAGYLKTKRMVHYPTLFSRMKASVINEAKNKESYYASNRPTRRASEQDAGYNSGYWKTIQNVHRCIVGHAVADSNTDKDTFLNAMVLEADWGLGRNSLNIIYMTTAATNLASKRSIENAYTTGRNDGTPGVHPGHTPYLNTDDWPGTMIMGKPSWMTAKCYPIYGSEVNGWPKAEGYFNTRYVYAHSEFTPQQTMRGKAALYGYLYGLYKIAADFDGDSDVDMLDLADFADSWLKVPGNAGYDSRANLYADSSGIVDFSDFAVFANKWTPAP